MDDTGVVVGRGRRYPRVCGQCGVAFVAGRRDARWCSSACRVRAWRRRHATAAPVANVGEWSGLLARIGTLETALQCAQAANVCSVEGCQLAERGQADRGRLEQAHRTGAAAWREQEERHPAVHGLREQLATQAGELARLREENSLLRRWVSKHPDTGAGTWTGE